MVLGTTTQVVVTNCDTFFTSSIKYYFQIFIVVFFFAECRNVFALVTKELNKKEKLYAFMLTDEDLEKVELLTTLSKHISNTTCRADFVSIALSKI